jgi:protein-disulfide isomerase
MADFIAGARTAVDDVGRDDHVRGPAHAPVTLVEYGDYQCDACGRAHGVLDAVLAELGSSVRFVFRNFPLIDAHSDAQMAAEAAESVAAHAGEEAFWAMHDILYENQDALDVDDLLGYAEAAGADPRVVADDLASGAMRPRVRADYRSGVRGGVRGTPTFFVNGRRFTGDWTDSDAFIAFLQDAMHASLRE